MKTFIGILFALTLLGLASSAHACSLAVPQLVIDLPLDEEIVGIDDQCLDSECVFSLDKQEYGEWWIVFTNAVSDEDGLVANLHDGSIYADLFTLKANPTLASDDTFLLALDALIKRDITPLRDAFPQHVGEWIESSSDFFLAGDLTLRLYDANEAAELVTEAEQELGQCRYSEVAAYSGEWMFVRDGIRPYCFSYGGTGASCPTVRLDHKEFIRYNLDNLSVVGIPYLMKYLIGLGAVVWGIFSLGRWIILRKRKNSEEESNKKK